AVHGDGSRGGRQAVDPARAVVCREAGAGRHVGRAAAPECAGRAREAGGGGLPVAVSATARGTGCAASLRACAAVVRGGPWGSWRVVRGGAIRPRMGFVAGG